MVRVREFAAADIPDVVGLFEQVYPEQRWPSRRACESYFREIFFANPWHDLELPSWVAQERDGIVGFAGVLPRRMAFGTRALRVAVGCQFMVHPGARHSLVALQLARKIVGGPQDLYIADGSNEQARHILLGIGGTVPMLQNLDWTRLLRPTRYVLGQLDRRGSRHALALAARGPCALADAVAARLHPNHFERDDDGVTDEELDADTMLAPMADVLDRGYPLRSLHDPASLKWLLGQALRKIRHGRLRARAVLERGRLLGWFIYYARAGSINDVLQFAARDTGFDRVLQRLFRDAWRQGATALRGRLYPPQLQQFSNRHCWLRREGTWTLVHSRHCDLVGAIERGAAGLSRLDGEWWLRFIGG